MFPSLCFSVPLFRQRQVLILVVADRPERRVSGPGGAGGSASPGPRLCPRLGGQQKPATHPARAVCPTAGSHPQRARRPRLRRRRRPEMAAACAAAGSPGAVLRGSRGPGSGRRAGAAGLTCTPVAAAGSGSRRAGLPTPPPRPRRLAPFAENQTQTPRKLQARPARVPGAPTVCRASGPPRPAVQAATRFAAGQTQLRPLPPRMA